MLRVSAGIPAYNEEANIGQLLEALLNQRLKKVQIREILVVASGCTDQTVKIVQEYRKKNPKIKLLRQRRRLGKTSADNLILEKAKSEILVLECADTLPEKDCFERLISPFSDPQVGVTAARMLPLNAKKTLPGYFSHLWWRLWHRVTLKFFRGGEIIAFRKAVKKIPRYIGADEVYLIDEILAQGYKARYIPQAVVYNMGPQTIGDILRMRRRHAAHHLQFRRFGPKVYYPKTMDNLYVFRLFLKEVNWFSLKEAIFGISSLILEAVSRILAYRDTYLVQEKEDFQIWERSQSTKKLLSICLKSPKN